MRTIEEQISHDASPWGLFWSNMRLMLRIGRMLVVYLIQGGRIRRAYRVKEAKGDIFWVDEEL